MPFGSALDLEQRKLIFVVYWVSALFCPKPDIINKD